MDDAADLIAVGKPRHRASATGIVVFSTSFKFVVRRTTIAIMASPAHAQQIRMMRSGGTSRTAMSRVLGATVPLERPPQANAPLVDDGAHVMPEW